MVTRHLISTPPIIYHMHCGNNYCAWPCPDNSPMAVCRAGQGCCLDLGQPRGTPLALPVLECFNFNSLAIIDIGINIECEAMFWTPSRSLVIKPTPSHSGMRISLLCDRPANAHTRVKLQIKLVANRSNINAVTRAASAGWQ